MRLRNLEGLKINKKILAIEKVVWGSGCVCLVLICFPFVLQEQVVVVAAHSPVFLFTGQRVVSLRRSGDWKDNADGFIL